MQGKNDHTIIRVLMTGAGAPGAAGILKCLTADPHIEVVTADANPDSAGHYLSKEFVQIPRADDPAFIETLLSVCRQKNIHVVLPLVTRELMHFATHINDFEMAGTRISITAPASLEIAINKSRVYEFLQWRGIPVPDFRIVETVEQFSQALVELGYPDKTVCFKPSLSNGSRGFRIITELVNEADLLFNHKPANPFMRKADAVRILSSAAFPELLVSEFLPGPEYSVDCLCNHGVAVAIVPRLRKKMINGISVEGEFVKEDAIMEYCSRIIHELKLNGNIGIQVKQATSGAFLLLEINPRVQGTISAALGAGINLPLLAVKQALGIPFQPAALEIKWGVKFTRYWNEVFH
jgi:carbamoyl-phosphate synthase large subunit